MENHSFATAKVFDFKKEVDYSDNGIVSKRVLDKAVGNITLFSFDAGQRLSEHTAPFDAFIQVIEGNAEILIDGKPFQLQAGESIIMPANIPHAVNATARFKMVLTMIKS
jgi:quercetin dioxygenase-like cupin family protein